MKTNNKKHTKKLLPWLASISFFAVGAMAIMPMATACSNGGDTPPEPSYAEDPTDTTAKVMIEDTNFKVFTDGMYWRLEGSEDIKKFDSVIFKGYSKKSEIYKYSYTGTSWVDDKKYIEFGENFSLLENTPRAKTFELGFEFSEHKNIGMLVLRQLWRESDRDVTRGYKFTQSGTLNNVRNVFFDFHFSTLVDPTEEASAFTTNPESIYIREGNGEISDWMKKLNVTDEKIFKIVAPK